MNLEILSPSLCNILASSVCALNRNTLRKTFQIGTIIVYHVILLNPSEPPPVPSIELLVLPRATSECPGGGCMVRVDIEPPVVGGEWGLGPVGLDKPTLGGPLVRIPQA